MAAVVAIMATIMTAFLIFGQMVTAASIAGWTSGYMGLVDRRPVFPSVHGVSGPETGCMPYPSHGVLGTASPPSLEQTLGGAR